MFLLRGNENNWKIIFNYYATNDHFSSFFFQHKVLKYTKDVPDELKDTLDHESFEKARVYQLDRSSFGFVSGAYSQVETTVRYIHQWSLQSY